MRLKLLDDIVTQTIFCSRGTAANKTTFTAHLIGSANQAYFRYDRNTTVNTSSPLTPAEGLDYTISMDGNSLYCRENGRRVVKAASGTFTPVSPFSFFASHLAGSALGDDTTMNNFAYIRLYDIKIWNAGGELTAWYRPARHAAYADTVQEYGLFDRVSGIFRTNKGTLEFVPGGIVPTQGETLVVEDAAEAAGACSPAAGAYTYAAGSSVNCTAQPGTNTLAVLRSRVRGYRLETYDAEMQRWTNPREFEGDVYAHEQVEGEVTRLTWLRDFDVKITAGASANGALAVNDETLAPGGHAWTPRNQRVKIAGVPDAGYKFDGWTDGVDELRASFPSMTLEYAQTTNYTPTFRSGANAKWLYDATAKTVEHGETGVKFTVTASSTNLTLKTIANSVADMTLDFTDPCTDADGNPYVIKTPGTVLKSNATLKRLFLSPHQTLANQCFMSCTNLASVYLADGLTELPNQAFQACNNLRALRVPDTFVKFGTQSFYCCYYLDQVTPQLPESVEWLGDSTFRECSNMVNYAWNLKNIRKLGSWAIAWTGVTNIDLTGNCLTNYGCFGSVRKLRRITPFFADTLESIGAMHSWPHYANRLTGKLIISNPRRTAEFPADFLLYTGVREIDCTGLGSAEYGSGKMAGNYALTNVVFGKNFSVFSSGTGLFQLCGRINTLRFRGDAPECRKNPHQDGSAAYAIMVPYQNDTWREGTCDSALVEHAQLTSSDCSAYRLRFDGEPIPEVKLRLSQISSYWPMRYWLPEPPTKTDKYPLDYHLAVHYDTGVYPNESILFNGTGWAAYTNAEFQAEQCWYGAPGDSETFELPAKATTARSLKLTSYTLYQNFAGNYVNSRAPTAWRLEGKRLGSDEWTTIHEADMDADDTLPQWASRTDPDSYPLTGAVQLVPPRTLARLTFDVPAETQLAYTAFRFTPLKSYNSENLASDATPFGLMEVRLYGVVTSTDPVVESFSVARRGWEDLAFTLDLKSFGENAATGEQAASAVAWLELASDADFTEIAATTAPTAVALGTNELTVAALAHDTAYYARVVVSNDLEGAETKTLAEPVLTLDVPFEGAGITVGEGGEGEYVFDFDLKGWYAESGVIKFYYGNTANPAAQQLMATVAITGPGVIRLGGFGVSRTPFLRAVIEATDDGTDYSRTFESAALPFWIYKPDSLTLSNVMERTTFTVTAAGEEGFKTNLTLKTLVEMGVEGVVDLTMPILEEATERDCSVVGVGTAMKGCEALTEVALPDSVEAIAADAFNACVGLERVALPVRVTKIGSYAFYDCMKLDEVTPLFPNTLTNIDQWAFGNCQKLAGELSLKGLITLGASAFAYSKVTKMDFGEQDRLKNLGDIRYMSKLIEVKPLLPKSVETISIFGSWDGACNLKGDLYLRNPNCKGSLVLQQFAYVPLGSIDMYGSSIAKMTADGDWAYASGFTNIVFSEAFDYWSTNCFNMSSKVKRTIRFTGYPFETLAYDVFRNWDEGYICYCLPRRHRKEWQEYLDAHCTVENLTAAERARYHQYFPHLHGGTQKVKMPSTSAKWFYLKWWSLTPPGLMVIVR